MSRFYIAMSSIDGIYISSTVAMVFYRLDTFNTIYLWIYEIYQLLLHYSFCHVFLMMAILCHYKAFMTFWSMDTIHLFSWILIHFHLLSHTTNVENQVASLTENISHMSDLLNQFMHQ